MTARSVVWWVAAAVVLLLAAPLLLHPQDGALAFGPAPGLDARLAPGLLAAALAWLFGVPAGGYLWWRGLAPYAALLAPFLAPVLAGALVDAATLSEAMRVLAEAVLLLPLTALATLLSLARLNPESLSGAAANGASPALLASGLILPLAWPGVLLGGTLAVLLALQSAALWLPVPIQATALAALATASLPWPQAKRH
jgi:hypothetical protein